MHAYVCITNTMQSTLYALFEPSLAIFVRSTTVVLAAVARGNLEAVCLLQHTEMQRSDRDIF